MLVVTLALLLHLSALPSPLYSSKVVDFGPKLSEFVKQHPDKGWLIKFYAPWCHHCQQLEPIFNNVAERIYKQHDHLVVGKVDCTKNSATCEHYKVQAYPTIMFLNKKTTVKYKGERTEKSLIEFAERLSGPDVIVVQDCDHLRKVVDQHGHIVLSTDMDSSSKLHKQFKELALRHKENWWFYHMNRSCDKSIHLGGLYIMKRHMMRAIRFKEPDNDDDENFAKALNDWLSRESFPVYSEFNWINYERILYSQKLLVIAVLDEYKPAKILSKTSRELKETMEGLSRKFSRQEDDLLFLWSSDSDLINSIAITRVSTPNVMLLKSDYSYQLLISNETDLLPDKKSKRIEKLQMNSIGKFIKKAPTEDYNFTGGNSIIHSVIRSLFSIYYKVIKLYQADPLLVSILMIFPSFVVIFVLYSTCFGDRSDGPAGQDTDSDLDDSDRELNDNQTEESQQLLSKRHKKQD